MVVVHTNHALPWFVCNFFFKKDLKRSFFQLENFTFGMSSGYFITCAAA